MPGLFTKAWKTFDQAMREFDEAVHEHDDDLDKHAEAVKSGTEQETITEETRPDGTKIRTRTTVRRTKG